MPLYVPGSNHNKSNVKFKCLISDGDLRKFNPLKTLFFNFALQ